MNVSPAQSERKLLGRLREILADLSWPAEFRGGARDFDAVVELRSARGKAAKLFVECKTELRPSTFPSWAEPRAASAAASGGTPVLGLPVVSPRMADLCRQAGWGWFDLAGNCRIDVAGVLHIARSGTPPVRPPRTPRANLGTAAAARVLRALLSPAHAGWAWKQRELQQRTCWHIDGDSGVSLGLVNKVVRHLVDQGFVEPADDEGVRVTDMEGLLAAWRDAYRFDRHDRRSCFTLLKGPALDRALYRVALGAADAVVYAAFSAAERQAPHVRQPRTWVYARRPYFEDLLRHAEAKEVDTGENLVVLVPEDAGVFLSFDPDPSSDATIGCTDPVQTYVDLWHSGGRGEEAAQALFTQRILPAWKAHGIA